MSDNPLTALCRALAKLKERRGFHEAEAKRHKAKEDEVEGCILKWMDDNGQESVRLSDGLGTVFKRTTDWASFEDVELATSFMLDRLIAAREQGLPLTDQLITNKAVMKSAVKDWAERELRAAGEEPDYSNTAGKLAEIGIRYGTRTNISLVKGK